MGETTHIVCRRLTLVVVACAAAALQGGCGSSVTTTTTSPGGVSRCDVSISASNSSIPAAGGVGRVTVTTDRECAWTATSDASWLSITSAASGQGEGSIDFRAAANPDPVTRRAGVTLNDKRAEVTQSAADCVITLSAGGATFGQGGGTGSIGVVASSQLCTWTASADVPWISITSATGKGSASVSFTVAAMTGSPRAGTVTVAGQQFSVTQAQTSQECQYSINPQSGTFGSAGGNGTINVVTGSGCPWVSSTNVPWIHISEGASGGGPGVVTFAVDATTGPSRAGTVFVAGSPFTVEQSPGCSFQVSPTTLSVNAGGGPGSIAVTTAAGCPWTSASGSPWITITAGASGSGNGTVTFQAQATNGPGRSGTLTVAGQTVTVNQGTGCSISLSTNSTTVPAAGGSRSFNVQAGDSCSWTATSNVPWITIAQGGSGSGNGTVRVDVAANSGAPRNGTVTVGGVAFSVQQDSGCSYTLSANSTNAPIGGGPGSVGVQTTAGCSWTASSNVSWITITGGGSGTGNGTVQFTVASNTGSPPRSGTLTIAGRTFTVNQAGACSFALSSQQQPIGASGGSLNVGVTTTASCSWSATSNVNWITVTQGASGTGNGNVALSVASTTGPARNGTVTIAGLTFTVQQASGCTFTVSPTSRNHNASGGGGDFNVSTTSGCAWKAVSDVPWVTIKDGSDTGNGKVQYDVARNTGAARKGTITVGNAVFSVTQSGS